MIRFITQTRALQGVSILYVLSRDRAATSLDRDVFDRHRRAMRTYERAATHLHPGLQFASTDEPERTLVGMGSDKVHIRYGAAAVLALTLSTGCALDVYGTGPAPSPDAGGAPTVAVVDDGGTPTVAIAEPRGDAAPTPSCGPTTCTDGCCVDGICIATPQTVQFCGALGRACVDCRTYGAYCNGDGFCSIDPVGAPAGWDGGR
jgi:hypothetical protein